MKTYNFFTNEPDSLLEAKADFLLLTNGVTQATALINDEQLPSDADFASETLVPALLTRAIHNLNPFSAIEVLDLKTQVKSETPFDAKDVFLDGMEFGRTYPLKGSYLILETNTRLSDAIANATMAALRVDDSLCRFEKLSQASDAIILFVSGFLLEATRRFHVVLGGGLEMVACLLVADALREDVLMQLKSKNLTLAMTVKEETSSIKMILKQLSYTPHAIYTTFSFATAEIEELKKYTKTALKDNAGASLAYANANNLTNKEVLDSVELVIYMM